MGKTGFTLPDAQVWVEVVEKSLTNYPMLNLMQQEDL
jgi:hypothetical protein